MESGLLMEGEMCGMPFEVSPSWLPCFSLLPPYPPYYCPSFFLSQLLTCPEEERLNQAVDINPYLPGDSLQFLRVEKSPDKLRLHLWFPLGRKLLKQNYLKVRTWAETLGQEGPSLLPAALIRPGRRLQGQSELSACKPTPKGEAQTAGQESKVDTYSWCDTVFGLDQDFILFLLRQIDFSLCCPLFIAE